MYSDNSANNRVVDNLTIYKSVNETVLFVETCLILYICVALNKTHMTVELYSALKMRDIKDFINEHNIKKEDIISILQDADHNFVLTYTVD